MKKEATWLLEYRSDTYSQTGEDGIIAKILNLLPQRDKWCVEFGAWDGKYLSNVRDLIENRYYSAVFIEGNKTKYIDLLRSYEHTNKVIAINRFVGFEEHNNLTQILETTPIPRDFDFLSIDIDGNDYHVWQALSSYSPKLICIEFNPTIPTEVDFVQPADPAINQGCSLRALVRLGKSKGYELVSVLPWNAFFVKAEYFPLFHISDNRPDVLRVNLEYITYLFSGYDGKIFLDGYKKLPWHGVELEDSSIHSLPAYLQKYPSNYSKTKYFVFQLFKSLGVSRSPIAKFFRRGRSYEI